MKRSVVHTEDLDVVDVLDKDGDGNLAEESVVGLEVDVELEGGVAFHVGERAEIVEFGIELREFEELVVGGGDVGVRESDARGIGRSADELEGCLAVRVEDDLRGVGFELREDFEVEGVALDDEDVRVSGFVECLWAAASEHCNQAVVAALLAID